MREDDQDVRIRKEFVVYLKKLFQCLGKTTENLKLTVITGSAKIEGWVPVEYMFVMIPTTLVFPYAGWSLRFMRIHNSAT
jgi:hypothetical protein